MKKNRRVKIEQSIALIETALAYIGRANADEEDDLASQRRKRSSTASIDAIKNLGLAISHCEMAIDHCLIAIGKEEKREQG